MTAPAQLLGAATAPANAAETAPAGVSKVSSKAESGDFGRVLTAHSPNAGGRPGAGESTDSVERNPTVDAVLSEDSLPPGSESSAGGKTLPQSGATLPPVTAAAVTPDPQQLIAVAPVSAAAPEDIPVVAAEASVPGSQTAAFPDSTVNTEALPVAQLAPKAPDTALLPESKPVVGTRSAPGDSIHIEGTSKPAVTDGPESQAATGVSSVSSGVTVAAAKSVSQAVPETTDVETRPAEPQSRSAPLAQVSASTNLPVESTQAAALAAAQAGPAVRAPDSAADSGAGLRAAAVLSAGGSDVTASPVSIATPVAASPNPAMTGRLATGPGMPEQINNQSQRAVVALEGQAATPPTVAQSTSLIPAASSSTPPQPLMPAAMTPASTLTAPTAAFAGAPVFGDISARPGSEAWGEQIVARMQLAGRHGLERMELQLHPAELGKLEIQINTDEDGANVLFVSQNRATRDLLEAELPRLRDLFGDAGIELGESEISDQSLQQRRERMDGHESAVARDGAGSESQGPTIEAAAMLTAPRSLIDYYV